VNRQMWVEKYRPKNAAEVMGNEEAKVSFIKWLKKKHKQKAVLLFGPAGVGKTALVHAAARDFNYKVIEMNASDTRTTKTIMEIAGPAVSTSSLDVYFLSIKGSLLLFDEVDGIFGREDRGGVGAIVKIISESQIPIVLTANDPDIQKLRPIIEVCDLIKFREVRPPLIVALLQKICRLENISAEKEALETIVQNSQGDVRSAINDLQTVCEGKRILRKEDVLSIPARNRGLDIRETLRGVFSAASPREARKILNESLIDYDTLLLAIHDNLPLRYSDPENLAAAYDVLSRADVFRGRIGTEEWRLLSYVFDLLAQSTTIAPAAFHPFNIIFPPTKFSLLKRTATERSLLESICAKIGEKCHVSKRSANLEFIPFLKVILKKESDQASKIAAWLRLDEESSNYLKKVD